MLAALLGAFLLLVGCESKKVLNADESTFKTFNETKKLSFSLKGDANFHPDQPSYCENSVFIFFPTSLNGTTDQMLTDSLMSKAFPEDKVSKDLKSAIDRYINNYDYDSTEVENVKVIEEIPEASRFRTSHSVTLTPKNIAPNCVSFEVSHYDYMEGAAHGYGYDVYVNYDSKNKKVLSLADLFVKNDVFKQEVKKQLLQQNEVETFEALKEKGFIIEEDEFFVTNNFYIDQANWCIVLLYQPYEIGCYALGTIEIPLYTYNFEQYMTPLAKNLLNH